MSPSVFRSREIVSSKPIENNRLLLMRRFQYPQLVKDSNVYGICSLVSMTTVGSGISFVVVLPPRLITSFDFVGATVVINL